MARDLTIRFRNRYCTKQIPEREARDLESGVEVVVERRLDGEIRFRFGNRHLVVNAPGRSQPAAPLKPADPKQAKRRPPKPGPDHPWRKRFAASVRLAMARKRRDARDRLPAASAPVPPVSGMVCDRPSERRYKSPRPSPIPDREERQDHVPGGRTF